MNRNIPRDRLRDLMGERDGMPCPRCGEKSVVLVNRGGDETNTRRRVCKNGHRFNTIEYVFPLDKDAGEGL